jgi:peptidoglycan/LPS O-acetylase OafA/YrhL
MPALDGVRGLAVIAVLLFHGGFEWARGGWLGVSIFFTLSGFLITNLLVAEWARTGTISLPTFWSRRFRRLMPAAIACLLGIALYGWVLASPEQLRHLRGDLLAALGYVANWRFLLTDVSYADLFAAPSPAQHFWSLAIEEQFYVFYPLIALGALRLGGRRALAAFLGIAAVASLALAYAVRADLDRMYYGTDTRMLELVAGALVALWWSARPSRQTAPRGRTRRTSVTALGLVALGGSIALWPSVSQTATQVTRGVLPLQALLSVGIILAVARPTPLARALAWRPLVGAGLISYGLYLYHWPIFLALSPERTELSTAPLFALRIAATLAVALLSYRFLEQPIRHRRVLLTRPVVTTAVLGGAAAVVLAAVAVTWSPAETQIAHADIDPDDRTVEVARGRTDATTVPGQGSLLVVGDSGTYDIAPGLEALHLALGAPAVVDATFPGFGLSRDGWEEDYRKHVTEHDVKLTVVMLGGWDLDYVEANGRGAYEERLERAVEIFTARGGKVLWLGMMPFGIDPEMNRIYQALAKRHAGDVAFGDIGPALQGPDGDYPRWLRDRAGDLVLARKPDGWHICPDGAVIVARSITEQTAALGWSAPPTTGWEDGRWRSDRRYDDPPGGCDPDREANRKSMPDS